MTGRWPGVADPLPTANVGEPLVKGRLRLKMAASKGYRCEFLGAVSEDFYCKKCTLVARRLTIISCCGESFCHACIADTKEQGKPCPACGEEYYNILEHVKNQRRINCLQVYCSTKERGCGWSGTLEQLDTHLDPDQDNCQYVDTKCPLNCHMTIPKNKVEQHVAQYCAKRPCVCQFCNFKATYEEVVDKHLPECKYVPLQCPNLCGVTFERDFMEDHMKMCPLEEVWCEFSSVGCDCRFIREDQEEHTRQNSQKHLTLTTSLAVETKQFQQKLLEQNKTQKEGEEKLRQKIEELEKKDIHHKENLERTIEELENTFDKEEQKLTQEVDNREKKLQELETKLGDQEKNLKQQGKKLDEQEKKLKEQNEMLEELKQMLQDITMKSDQNEMKASRLTNRNSLDRSFEMKNFSREKAKDEIDNWKSPALYTHVYGYKFCIGVDANGCEGGRGYSICVTLWSMSGAYDGQLKWPVEVEFTIELINQQGRRNKRRYVTKTWRKPAISCYRLSSHTLLEHADLEDFLKNDTLYFYVSEIEILG